MVALTWLVPICLFFTSINGWQYFVGYRSVPDNRCYVQYMESALFNCLLQVAYFWLTLGVMCALYAGIYRVALRLQRNAKARRTKMAASIVSVAGQTITRSVGESRDYLAVGRDRGRNEGTVGGDLPQFNM